MKFTKLLPPHWSTGEGLDKAQDYISKDRGDLMLGDRSDLRLANDVFLASRHDIGMIHYQMAASDRIRWLSAQLAKSNALLTEVRDACLVGDDEGVTVTQEPHVSEDLFNRINDTVRLRGYEDAVEWGQP